MSGAFVYVAARPDGAHKIGFSTRPEKRRLGIASELRQPVSLVDHKPCAVNDGRRIEALAHDILREHHVGGEWFFVDEASAVAAVEAALIRFAQGQRSPRPLTREVDLVSRLQPLWGYVYATLDRDDVGLLRDAWRQFIGAMAEFERELIVERTKAGLAAAKAKGRVGGARPQWTEEGRARAQIMLKKGVPVKYVRAETGISRALLYRWKKEMSS